MESSKLRREIFAKKSLKAWPFPGNKDFLSHPGTHSTLPARPHTHPTLRFKGISEEEAVTSLPPAGSGSPSLRRGRLWPPIPAEVGQRPEPVTPSSSPAFLLWLTFQGGSPTSWESGESSEYLVPAVSLSSFKSYEELQGWRDSTRWPHRPPVCSCWRQAGGRHQTLPSYSCVWCVCLCVCV